MLICFPFPSEREINLLQSRPEKRATKYKNFTNSKWFATHNLLSEILRQHIPYQVLEFTYGLGPDELKRATKEYMKKHPNFQCD